MVTINPYRKSAEMPAKERIPMSRNSRAKIVLASVILGYIPAGYSLDIAAGHAHWGLFGSIILFTFVSTIWATQELSKTKDTDD